MVVVVVVVVVLVVGRANEMTWRFIRAHNVKLVQKGFESFLLLWAEGIEYDTTH